MAKKPKYVARKVNGQKVDEHRLIMEQHLGRKLDVDEVVHHKDGNHKNNSIDNLEVMKRKKHSRMHGLNRTQSEATKNKRRIVAQRKRPAAKLEVSDIKRIREMLDKGMTYKSIAEVFGVDSSQIYKIKHGITWSWVE